MRASPCNHLLFVSLEVLVGLDLCGGLSASLSRSGSWSLLPGRDDLSLLLLVVVERHWLPVVLLVLGGGELALHLLFLFLLLGLLVEVVSVVVDVAVSEGGVELVDVVQDRLSVSWENGLGVQDVLHAFLEALHDDVSWDFADESFTDRVIVPRLSGITTVGNVLLISYLSVDPQVLYPVQLGSVL